MKGVKSTDMFFSRLLTTLVANSVQPPPSISWLQNACKNTCGVMIRVLKQKAHTYLPLHAVHVEQVDAVLRGTGPTANVEA